nr:translation initiation factor IF-3 [Pararhodobacter sp. CCB-MM2]
MKAVEALRGNPRPLDPAPKCPTSPSRPRRKAVLPLPPAESRRPRRAGAESALATQRPHDYFSARLTYRRNCTIARRPHNAPPSRDTGPRVNDRIRATEIRLIGADGENVGVVPPARAMAMAAEAGLDLVEISPNATPPVCKIMDFGKFKYEQQKREAEARKKQKTIEIKEIKFRPGTDTHDYDVKMRSVQKFLGEGDKVKVTLRFKGREMAHQQLGMELLNRVAADVQEIGKIENMPKLEGRQMVMMIGPK